jgi:putative ABC transport system permease protein
MLSPRWRKLIGDLRVAQGRLAMMVVALAVGIFGIVTILSAYTILTREISRNYLGTNPASAQIELDGVDAALVEAVRQRPGIADAEAGSFVKGRIEAGSNEWLPLLLFVVKDFNAMRISVFRPEAGAWPPPPGSMLLERTALPLVHGKVGGVRRIQISGGVMLNVVISGLVHDPGLAPSWQEQTAYGYIAPATLPLIGEPPTLRVLKVTVSKDVRDIRAIEHTVASLATWLKQEGHTVEQIRIPPPRMHPHQTQMTAILVMLLLFSAMALILSAILTTTIIGGLLAQQIRQIGVMKAIGARSWQIANIYFFMVAAMGVVAVILGLPLGIAAGRGFARAVAELLNFTLYSEAVPIWIYPVQMLTGVVVPLLIALVPIRKATRVTVREAISDFGVRHDAVSASRIDTLLAKLRGPDRTLLLAIRNSFRRRGRLALTLGLLAVAGAMFLTSLNVKSAWERNLAQATSDRRYDLEIQLAAPVAEDKLLQIIQGVPGVQKVEAWNILPAAAERSDGLEIVRTYPDGGHGSFSLRSAPPQSGLLQLTLLDGRWLRPTDSDALVLNHTARAMLRGVKPGEYIDLRIQDRPVRFHVVGIAREIITPAAAYTSPEGFQRAAGLFGQCNAVRVVTSRHDQKTVLAITRNIDRALEREGVGTKVSISESRLSDALSGHVYILIFALIMMSALMAIVGALGLSAAMGTGVVERTREFGVMRTIGARTATVLRNVMSEGIFIGVLSWCIAIVLSVPLSAGVGRLIGTLAFRSPLPLFLSPLAIALWLTLIVLGSMAASAYPAWKASQLTIRETLAHF